MTFSVKSNADGSASLQKDGQDVLTIGTDGRVAAMIASHLGAVAGSHRNNYYNSGTFTADEVVVTNSLGGAPVRLVNVNKTINTALNTNGVGGMDTGTGPVNGFVAVYLIYNPTTQASGLLAVNATAATAPEVYGGANMPAGYTHSALVAVLATGSGGGLGTMFMIGRTVYFGYASVATGIASATYASFSLAVAVPKNAKVWGGWVSVLPTASVSAGTAIYLAANVSGLVERVMQIPGNANGLATAFPVDNMPILTQQTCYYKTVNPNGNTIAVNSYTF